LIKSPLYLLVLSGPVTTHCEPAYHNKLLLILACAINSKKNKTYLLWLFAKEIYIGLIGVVVRFECWKKNKGFQSGQNNLLTGLCVVLAGRPAAN